MLPNFFVIGAYKSGTTSLHQYLSQHPQVFMPTVKEPSYFAFAASDSAVDTQAYRNSVKTREDYESLFSGASGCIAVGEVSPEYMTSPTAARSIKAVLPDAKLVAILRNPVERAYSDFLMYRRDGSEKTSDFAAALGLQSERSLRNDPTGNYVSTGFYGAQLGRYYELFPAHQIKVFFLEELENDGHRTLSQLFEFIGVDPEFVPADMAIYNRSGIASNYLVSKLFEYRHQLAPLARKIVPRGILESLRQRFEGGLKRPPLDPEVRKRLTAVFESDIRLLERLTGKSCRNWLS